MSDTVQEIKDKLSIADIVAQYVKLERAGSSMRARCPFHAEKTPSFFVSPDRGTYHCFGCNVHGDIFTFVQEIEGLDFKGALKLLADKAGVEIAYEGKEKKDARDRLYALTETATLFFRQSLAEGDAAHTYLTDRGLTPQTIRAFRIGFAPDSWRALSEHLRTKGYREDEIERAGLAKRSDKGVYDRFRSRVMFPIFDTAGRPVAFSGRHFEDARTGGASAAGQEPAKYINSPETPLFHKSRILYGFDRAKQHIRKLNFAILVEGQMDLVMSHQAGWGNTVAVSGTALTPEHVTLLKRMSDNLVIALDADTAGVRAATRSAHVALAAGMEVKVVALPPESDPADVIAKEGTDAWKALIRDAQHVVAFLLDVLERESKDTRALERAVSSTVLPFVASITNAIEREKWVRTTAARLGVSETAVLETLRSTPKLPPVESPTDSNHAAKDQTEKADTSAVPIPPRLRELWGIFLWQSALDAPQIDVARTHAHIKTAAGEEHATLSALPKQQEEALRFQAESRYGESEHIERDMADLIRLVQLDRLKRELAGATATLRRAEATGDDTQKREALAQCEQLATEIAKFGTIGYYAGTEGTA